VGSEPPKLDQPRLVPVERQAKAGQPRLEGQEHLFRICLVLKAYDEVISVAHDHNATAYCLMEQCYFPRVALTVLGGP
jgi:hypothetical protein